jgi:hypothetical protein
MTPGHHEIGSLLRKTDTVRLALRNNRPPEMSPKPTRSKKASPPLGWSWTSSLSRMPKDPEQKTSKVVEPDHTRASKGRQPATQDGHGGGGQTQQQSGQSEGGEASGSGGKK